MYMIYLKNKETKTILMLDGYYDEKTANKYKRSLEKELKRRGHDHIEAHVRKL